MLSLTTCHDADTITVTVRGEIDLATVDQLATEIAAAVRADATGVIVDLDGVTFLDSSGIGALLAGRKAADESGKSFHVTGANGIVREVLDLTGVWAHLSGQAS
jgi:anti-sigma B factor antagonist